MSAKERFFDKVAAAGDCWLWAGGMNPNGYPKFWADGHQYAHRFAQATFNAPIPAGMTVDHYRYPDGGCIGPACVNPEHLRLASQRENILRSSGITASAAAKTQCPQGHPYAGDNLYINGSGDRLCRECNRARSRMNYARRRAVA
ncbi:MAG: HNH endonuclease [Acidobacteria bacterium]|nr:HNH endonuclease [Acidobacteriota bacterium]